MFKTLDVDLESNTVVIGTSLSANERWHAVGFPVIWTTHTIPPYFASADAWMMVNISDGGQSETISLCFSDTLLSNQHHC